MLAPSKIVCIGRNYVKHIEELGNEIPEQMVVFNKPPSAISDKLVAVSDEPHHYEAELCFKVVAGQLAEVAVGLDLTKRNLQSYLKQKGLPWERAKAFDGSALFSDFLVAPSDVSKLAVELKVDGEVRQHGNVSHMMYSPEAILQQVQSFMSLTDGDILMTGTPEGVGVVAAGSVYELTLLDNDKPLTSVSWRAD